MVVRVVEPIKMCELALQNGELGDIVFSDGDFNESLGDISVMLRNRRSPFDFGITI